MHDRLLDDVRLVLAMGCVMEWYRVERRYLLIVRLWHKSAAIFAERSNVCIKLNTILSSNGHSKNYPPILLPSARVRLHHSSLSGTMPYRIALPDTLSPSPLRPPACLEPGDTVMLQWIRTFSCTLQVVGTPPPGQCPRYCHGLFAGVPFKYPNNFTRFLHENVWTFPDFLIRSPLSTSPVSTFTVFTVQSVMNIHTGVVAGISLTAIVAVSSAVNRSVRRNRQAAVAQVKPMKSAIVHPRSASQEMPFVFGNMVLITNM